MNMATKCGICGASGGHACAVPTLNPDAPCALCGAPTIHGVNSDFCSLTCESAHRAMAETCPDCGAPAFDGCRCDTCREAFDDDCAALNQ
jgi:hypothetical protein